MKRKMIVVALVMAMVLSMVTPGVGFAEEPKTLNYVVLGSSEANGYGLDGYVNSNYLAWAGWGKQEALWDASLATGEPTSTSYKLAAWNPHYKYAQSVSGYGKLQEGSYPAQIQKKLKAEFENDGYEVVTTPLAMNSMRPEELTVLLDETYAGDAYTAWRFTGEDGWFAKDGGLDELRSAYKSAIEAADIITYDLGSNDFGVYLANQLVNGNFASNDLNAVLASTEYASYVSLYYAARPVLEKQLLAIIEKQDPDLDIEINEETMAIVNNTIDTLAYALLGFMKHFDLNMEMIYALNQDVDMTVVSIQNPLSDCAMEIDGVPVPVGTLIDLVIDLANAYMSAGSEYALCYAYADLTEDDGHVATFLDELRAYNGTVSAEMKACFDVLDDDMYLKERVTKAIIAEEENFVSARNVDSEKYAAALTYAYQAAAQFLHDADAAAETINVWKMPDATEAGEMEAFFFDVCVQAALAAYDGNIEGAEGAKSIVANGYASFEEKFHQPERAFFIFRIWTVFGNSFFSQLSATGSKEAAEIIYTAMENNANGYIALAKKLVSTKEELIELGIQYGLKYARLLVEKFSEDTEDAELVAEFSAIFDEYWDEELFAEWITGYIDDGDTEKWLTLLDGMQSVATFMEKSGQIGQVVSGLAAILAKNTQFDVTSFSFTSLIRSNLVKNVVSQIKNFVKTY